MAKKEAPSRARLSILVAIALGLAVLVFARWWPTKTPQAAQPFASFAGRVVDTNGRPQANLTVDFECLGERPEHATQFDWNPSATTLADGTFRIRLPRTRVSASVRTRPLAHDAAVQFDLTAGSTQQLELQVVPSTSWPPIRGIVVDAGGKGLAGAEIGECSDWHVLGVATTDADGAFTVERDVGPESGWMDLRVAHPDHDDAQLWVRWGDDPVRVELRPRLQIEVRVVDADGRPFPVLAIEQRNLSAQSFDLLDDREPALVAEGAAWRGGLRRGDNSLAVRLRPQDQAEWFEPSPLIVRAADPGPIVVETIVRRAASRRVRVEDEAGQPIAAAELEVLDARGATVTAEANVDRRSDRDRVGPLIVASATTPDSGEADLRGPAGQPMLVRAWAKNFVATIVEAVDVGIAEPLVVRLRPAARVHGRVRMAPSAPSGTWLVFLRRPNGSPWCGRPDRIEVGTDGSFELADVPPGSWIVQLMQKFGEGNTAEEGHAAELALAPGDNRVTVDASAWTWTEVRARVRVDGAPAADADVWLERVEPERIDLLRTLVHTKLDAAGQFEGALRPGRYCLGVGDLLSPWHGPTIEIPDRAGADANTEWDVRTGELALQLVDARGAPARRVRLILLRDLLHLLGTVVTADDEGILRQRVPAGEWHLTWQDPDAALSWAGEAFVAQWFASRRPLVALAVRAGETTELRVVVPDAALGRR